MNLQKVALSLTNNGYKSKAVNETCLTINGKEVKIIGHLAVYNGKECAFGSVQGLMAQLWAAGLIDTKNEAEIIASEYQKLK